MVRNLVERVGRSFESLDAIVAAQSAAVPALILHDKADREVPFSFSEEMARAWKSSRLVPTSSGGHRRILRDPVAIEAAVDFGSQTLASRLV
jgi:pimeloyl-ACP methyl ester carboxylesterase